MSRAFLSGFILVILLIASPIGARIALADEFDLVPLSDPLYKQLALVQKSGWTGAASKAQPDTANQELTRYEIALETAKAIFNITARSRTDSSWAATASPQTLRSLKELTLAMRSELKKLDIDATSVAQLIDTLLKPAPITAPALNNRSRSQPANRVRPAIGGSARVTPRTLDTTATPDDSLLVQPQASIDLPLSQKLRIQTVLTSLAREAQDPLSKSRLSIAQTGAALDVTSWMTLRAGQERQFSHRGQFSLRSPLMNDADLLKTPEATVTSGGVDIVVRPGFTFSGNLARIAPGTGIGTSATRLEGGLGLTGWQNRLVLNANISRLMPEDSVALSATAATTAAKLNLDVGLTERLSLKLLYQQLFGVQPQRQSDRVVAGGITINF